METPEPGALAGAHPRRLRAFTRPEHLPAGHRVESITGGWECRHAIRSYYWLSGPCNLLEAYSADCYLDKVYADIGSWVRIDGLKIRFVGFELDVSRRPPHGARIVDEEDFHKAASRFGYSTEFQRACLRAARDAVDLADRWEARDPPAV